MNKDNELYVYVPSLPLYPSPHM